MESIRLRPSKPIQRYVQDVSLNLYKLATCFRCGGRFDEGSRITFEKEAALCDGCKVTGVKTSATKHLCAACQEVIVGTSIFAMDQEWHMNCFSCQVLASINLEKLDSFSKIFRAFAEKDIGYCLGTSCLIPKLL